MNLFSLRYGITVSFAVMIALTPLVKAEALVGECEKKCIQIPETVNSCWQDLENTISNNFNNLVNFFDNIFHISPCNQPTFKYDATLVGFVNFADGIGRHPILFKECLGKDLKLNFLSTRCIPPEIEDAQLGLPRLDPTKKEDVGAVAILTDILADKALNIYKKIPESQIKIAYTMFEATQIPYNWATILNTHFDAAVVPDPFYVDVYKNCGVQIPIFVLPLPLVLNDFLHMQPQQDAHKPFVFGYSGGFWKRKNHIRIIEAFAAEFGNRSDVKLRLHGRFGQENIIEELRQKIANDKLTNVELIVKPYCWEEYLEFFKSLDCCVCLSMGEGFSITPREALAAAKPCIVTNNTAQITVCQSGAVRIVQSNILVPAFYDCHYDNDYIAGYVAECCKACGIGNNLSNAIDEEDLDVLFRSGSVGYQFDCTADDARAAMRDVYENYTYFQIKSMLGREWVKQYLSQNLHKKYVSLVKPQSVILGNKNILADTFLMTNSEALYKKYQYLLGDE